MNGIRLTWLPAPTFRRDERGPVANIEWSFPSEGRLHHVEVAPTGEHFIEVPQGDNMNAFALRVFPFWISERMASCDRDIERALAEKKRLSKMLIFPSR